jgi:hypothetical protein
MKLGTNMLHKTVFSFTKSQQAETWTYHGTWVNFHVSKRTVGSFETLSLSLKEGTNGCGCLLRNVVTFGTRLVGTSKSLEERGTNGCHGWIGWNSHETHVATTMSMLVLVMILLLRTTATIRRFAIGKICHSLVSVGGSRPCIDDHGVACQIGFVRGTGRNGRFG